MSTDLYSVGGELASLPPIHNNNNNKCNYNTY